MVPNMAHGTFHWSDTGQQQIKLTQPPPFFVEGFLLRPAYIRHQRVTALCVVSSSK